MARTQAPNGIDMATWLRLRATRRAQRGVVAGYVHELSERHNGERSAAGENEENAGDENGAGTRS